MKSVSRKPPGIGDRRPSDLESLQAWQSEENTPTESDYQHIGVIADRVVMKLAAHLARAA